MGESRKSPNAPRDDAWLAAFRQPRKGVWFAAFREPDWELVTPTTVASVFRQNPIGPCLSLFAMPGFGMLFALETSLPPFVAVPAGAAAGIAVWWLLMLGYARGWVTDE